jgi:hypothetical protein
MVVQASLTNTDRTTPVPGVFRCERSGAFQSITTTRRTYESRHPEDKDYEAGSPSGWRPVVTLCGHGGTTPPCLHNGPRRPHDQ